VDEIMLYIAPMVFGGATSPTLADGFGLTCDAAIPLRMADVERWDDGGVLLKYLVDHGR
jgi:riboflavin biosynthesis pyrimidine reductase